MHQLELFRDTLGETGERSGLLQSAIRIIGEQGSGLVVLINQPRLDALSRTVETRSAVPTADAWEMSELRDYGIGAQILAELGVHEMVLLTNTAHTPIALAGYGLSIVGERPLPGLVFGQGE